MPARRRKLIIALIFAALPLALVAQVVISTLPVSAPDPEPSTRPSSATEAAGAPTRLEGTPLQLLYLPEIIKTTSRKTEVAIQNIGQNVADLEISLYSFDGDLASRVIVRGLVPGASNTYDPALDKQLANGQFSLVARIFKSRATAVALRYDLSANPQATAYTAAETGYLKAYLPNVTRQFFGWKTFVVIQNRGEATAHVSLDFYTLDGVKAVTIRRDVEPNRSTLINPELEAALTPKLQYAVTVVSDQPVSVLENLSNADEAQVANPVTYTVSGITVGSTVAYGPYVVKGVEGVGLGHTTAVVQNVSSKTVSAKLYFAPLRGGPEVVFNNPALSAGSAWYFDTRYQNGNTDLPRCESSSNINVCLPDGEYTITTQSEGEVATLVNLSGRSSADGYISSPAKSSRIYVPLAPTRWLDVNSRAQLVIYSLAASRATLTWRGPDGKVNSTTTVDLQPGSSSIVDTSKISSLKGRERYSVVIEATGPISVIVRLLGENGDGAATYTAFGNE